MADADEALMQAIDPWIIGSFGCADAARGIKAALAEAGYVIVPREPTEGMGKAGGESEPFNMPGTGPGGLWHPGQIIANTVWRAMIDAALGGNGVMT